MQHTHEELFGSDSDEAEAATPAVAHSPTASDARVDEILAGAAGAACRAALGRSPSASEIECYENDPDGFEEEMMDDEEEEDDDEEEEEEKKEEEEEEEEEELDDGEEEEGGEEATYSLPSLPSEHLKSVDAHVCKANAAGFYASDNNIVAVQLPVKASDDSINYLLVAARLVPKAESVRRQSRAVVTDRRGEHGELVMGQSMATTSVGTRCRLVANVLVHATTAASRTELQQIFGMQPFLTWLAILDHPDHPALVLEPVHTLQNVAPANEAEIKRFRAPEDASGERQESRGTRWLRLLFEGAVAGSVDGVVAPLLSMKEVGKAAKAAEKQVAAAATAASREAKEAAKAVRRQQQAVRRQQQQQQRTAAAAGAAAPPPTLPPTLPPPTQPVPPTLPPPTQPVPPTLPPPTLPPTLPLLWPTNGLPVGAVCSLLPTPGTSQRRVVTVVAALPTGTYSVHERSGRAHVVGSERLELMSLPPQEPSPDDRRRNERRLHDERRRDRRDEPHSRATPKPKAKRRHRSRDSSCSSSSSSSSNEATPFSAHQRRRRLDELEAADRAGLRVDVERDERKREKRRVSEKKKRKRARKRERRKRDS
jgi:hypothetical protein